MLYGSQHEQDDTRTQMGANLRVTRTFTVGGIDIRSTAGLQLREDLIEAQLHRTEQRQRLDGFPGIPGPIFDGQITETELGAYAEFDAHLTSWLRVVVAGREDRVDAAVNNESPTAVYQTSGSKGASQFSPKATVIASPVSQLDLFANFGQGFHTNDARSTLLGAINGVQPTLIAQATGYEVGATLRPLNGLTLTAVGFLLDITQELTVDGDTDTTAPSGPTRRYGGEFVGRYQFGHGFFADATLTIAHARYTDQADVNAGQALVPLAPTRTFAEGVGAREPLGPFTIVASAYVRSMADRPATQDGTLTATGAIVAGAQAGLRWKNFELGVDVINVGDAAWREGQFAVNARLPGEGPRPPTGMSFTLGELLARRSPTRSFTGEAEMSRMSTPHVRLVVSLRSVRATLAASLTSATLALGGCGTSTHNQHRHPPAGAAVHLRARPRRSRDAPHARALFSPAAPIAPTTAKHANLVCDRRDPRRRRHARFYCCAPYGQWATECVPVPKVPGCGAQSFGFACTGASSPDQVDPSLVCSQAIAGAAGAKDYCCVSADQTSPVCRCASFDDDAGACGGASSTCVGASIGFLCVGAHTPAELNALLSCDVPAGGAGGSFCCQTP